MKMKKILRSALAILCSASLVLGSFGMIIPTVKAAESLPTDFNEVTPADFGIADFSGNTDKVSHTSSLKPLQSADKMLFQTKVVFGSGTLSLLDKDVSTSAIEGINFWKSGNDAIRFNCSYAKIHVGGYYEDGTYKDGQIGFNAAGTEPYIYNMYPTLPIGTTSATAEFSMAITTEVVNFNEGTTANDLKLGVWFDGKLYNDTYFYLCDYIFTQDNILMTASVESITSPSVQNTNDLPTDFNEVTPREFGIADFSGNTEKVSYTSSLKPLQSADKMLFQTKVVFGSGILSLLDKDVSTSSIEGINFWKSGDDAIRFNCSYAKIHVGGYYEDGTYKDGQIGFNAAGTEPYIYNMYPTLPTGTTSATAELSMAITTEVVNFNEGTTADDLKVGVWFDGKLYNNTYFYLCDYIFTEDNILMTASVESITSPSVEVPYSDLTPAILGVPDTSDANGVTIKTPTTDEKLYNLDKTKFSANVHFQADRLSYFTYLYNEAGLGQIAFMVNQHRSALMIYNYKNTGDTTLYYGDKIADGVDIDTAYEKLANDESNCGFMLGSSAGYSFIGANASFSITTEFVDFDGDGNKDDLEIGIFIGGHEDKAKYAYYKDYEETTFKGIVSTYQVQAISSSTVENPATPVQPSDPPVETVYGDLTPAILGVPDTSDANGVTIKTPTTDEKLYNLDKTKFSANVHFQADRLSYFTYLYNESGLGQIAFMVNQHRSSLMIYNYKNIGDTTLYYGDKIADGVDIDTAYEKLANDESNCGFMLGSSAGYSFIGANASFSITTEFVDFDGDGNKDDLEIGIFVGGHEDKPKYAYYKDYEETTFKGVVSTYQVQAISSSTVENPATPVQPSTPPGPTNPDEDEPKEETLPTDFTEIAPNFFDIDDFKDNVEDPVTYQSTQAPFTSAHKVMLYADVVFGNGRTIEYLYNGATESGIMLWARENLHVRNYMSPSESAGMYIGGEFVNGEYKGGTLLSGRHDNYVIKASAFSLTENFDTLKVSLILTTEFVDFDGEGTANDLKLGVWFDEKLYDNTYIYMRNCLDTYTTVLKMNVVEMSSPISTGSGQKEDKVPVLPEITFSDFDIEDGTYEHNKENPKDFAITGSYREGFENQTFVGTVNFTDEPATSIGFAGKTSAWQGVRIVSRGDGNLSFVDANGQFPTVVIYAKLAKTTLTERDMEIGLTFEVTDLDGDGEKDDVRFWLTLDGVLYRNKPIVKAIDYAQYLGKFIGIYSDHETSSVTISSKDIQRPVREVDFSIMGFTKDWAKTLAAGSSSMTVGVAGNKAPYTADNTNYTNYVAICILAFVMLGGVFYSKGYGKKETD